MPRINKCFICDKPKTRYISYKEEGSDLLICTRCFYLPKPECTNTNECINNYVTASNKVHGKYYCLSCYRRKMYKYIDLYMPANKYLTSFVKKYI